MPYNKTQLPIKFSADLLNCRAALRYSKIGMFALRPQRALWSWRRTHWKADLFAALRWELHSRFKTVRGNRVEPEITFGCFELSSYFKDLLKCRRVKPCYIALNSQRDSSKLLNRRFLRASKGLRRVEQFCI